MLADKDAECNKRVEDLQDKLKIKETAEASLTVEIESLRESVKAHQKQLKQQQQDWEESTKKDELEKNVWIPLGFN